MWMILAQIGIEVGLFLINKYLNDALLQPVALPQDFTVAPSAQGSPIPLVYGMTRVNAPILAWYDNENTDFVVDSDGNPTGQYFYSVDLLFVLGVPLYNSIAGIRQVWYGDQILLNTALPGQGVIMGDKAQTTVIAATGSNASSIGMTGKIEIWGGLPTQNPLADTSSLFYSSFLRASMRPQGHDLTRVPGFRNQVLCLFSIIELDDSPRLPQIAFEVFSASDNGALGYDANPATVILDLITGPVWKLGIPTSSVDLTSFSACAAVLETEVHGYSNALSTQQDAKTVIADILKQIDGVLFQSPATGLITLRLIRATDPIVGTVTQDNTVGRPEYATTGWRQTYNFVRVTYPDRQQNYQNSVATAMNLANLAQQDNRLRTLDVSYPGCSNSTLAAALAARDLNTISRPVATANAVLNRQFYAALPGDRMQVTWPQYGVSKVMRVMQVDQGQLADGAVRVTFIEDVFDQQSAGFGSTIGLGTLNPFAPYPITQRLLTEAPLWLEYLAAVAGVNTTSGAPRLLVANAPSPVDQTYREATKRGDLPYILNPVLYPYSNDIPARPFETTFTLVNAYAREIEPYDTTTGLLIGNVVGALASALASLAWSSAQISQIGQGLFAVMTGTEIEIMAFESVTAVGPNFLLNNIWRGELDTPAIAHFVGNRGWFINAFNVGRKSWSVGNHVLAQAVPIALGFNGSGEEAVDKVAIVGRCLLPAPAQNLALAGKNMSGTTGLPAVAGEYKAVALFEEAIDIFAARREATAVVMSRGDAGDDTITTASVSWIPVATKIGGDGSAAIYPTPTPSAWMGAVAGGQAVLLTGHGSVNVGLQTQAPAGTSWRTPVVAVKAARWRNLLGNCRFDYGALTPCWAPGTGTTTWGNTAASSITLGGQPYITGGSIISDIFVQTIDITGYTPRAMSAFVTWYNRNLTATASMSVTVLLEALNAAGSTLTSSTFTATPPTATYSPVDVITIAALPALTAKLRVTATLTSGTGVVPVSAMTEFMLVVGQYQLFALGNYSFESAFTGWTNVTNSFVTGTAIAGPSPTYAQGGAFASSEIKQDYTLPVGYNYGTAVLHLWRASTLATDTGEAIIEIYDATPTLLASVTTGAEALTPLNVWQRRSLNIDLPDGAVTVRTRLKATRTLGSGNSGACFDEIRLDVHKHLDATYSLPLVFDTPTNQLLPSTWQEHYMAYPNLTAGIPANVWGGVSTGDSTLVWSDGTPRSAGVFMGPWGKASAAYGSSVSSFDQQALSAYPFTRTSGGGLVCLQANGGSPNQTGLYGIDDPFTMIVFFHVDEPGFSTICGLAGHMNASRGWGLEITASGQLQSLLRGASSTSKNVTTGRVCTEGGKHMGAIVYDPTAKLLWVYDEFGGFSISTASGLNDFINLGTDTDAMFRIGTDSPDRPTLPGQIGRVYLWNVALSAGDIAAQWTYGKDPTGAITTYTRTNAAIVPLPPDGSGNAQACVMSAAQVALAYASNLTLDGGTGRGLAVGKSATNLLPDVDFTGGTGTWVPDSAGLLTQSIVDPTGRPRGVTVAGTSSLGIKAINITLAASPANVVVTFWARYDTSSAGHKLDVVLMDASNVVKSTVVITLTTAWQRFDVTLGSWAGSTATGRVRFVPDGTSSPMTFDIAGIMCVTQGTDVCAILPLPGQTHGDYNATVTTTLPQQFNYEGEIWAQGVSMIDVPTPAAGSVVQATIGTTVNQRELQIISGSTGFRNVHYTSTGAHTDATTGYSTYADRIWKARARWNTASTLDTSATPFSTVAWTDDTHATPTVVTGRTAAWTVTATNLTTVKIGAGTAAPSDLVLREVMVRAREEKLV